MKKIISIILLTMCFISTKNVYAASFKTYIQGSSQISENGSVTLTVGVNNASNLWGFSAPISYDSSKLNLVNSVGLNGFGIAVGSNFVCDNSTGKNGSFKVATLTFKATSNFKVGDSTSVSLGNAEGSDGENILSGSGSSISIKIVPPKSNNNNLSSLTIDGYKLDFDKDKTEYKLEVENNVESVKINASASDEKAKITGTGNVNLDIYTNEIEIKVISESGDTKTYKITIVRKDSDGNTHELSNDNSLKNFTIKDYYISFNPEILEYTILLKNNNKLEIDVEKNEENQSITIDGNDSKIKEGNNIITIKVISENGEEKDYIINAIYLPEKEEKKDDKSLLLIISIIVNIILILFIIIDKTGLLKTLLSKIKK